MRSYVGVIILAGLLALAHKVTAAPVFNEFDGFNTNPVHKIIQYLDARDDSSFVIIDGGTSDGHVEGTVFKTYRSGAQNQGEPVWITTGELKAVEVQKTRTIARVLRSGTELSKAFFPRFPGVMAGDLAVSQRMAIVRRQSVTPTTTLSYFKLFEDPRGNPGSFELSDAGRALLSRQALAFAGAKMSLLMVEGYTDHKGPSSVNQVESYQRAMTVRQFLIEEMGFDPDRILAVGYGETEQVDTSLAPGYAEANRRIVLKIVPVKQ